MPKMEALASDPRSRYEKRYRIARGGMRRLSTLRRARWSSAFVRGSSASAGTVCTTPFSDSSFSNSSGIDEFLLEAMTVMPDGGGMGLLLLRRVYLSISLPAHRLACQGGPAPSASRLAGTLSRPS
jgi:hypothetical protein